MTKMLAVWWGLFSILVLGGCTSTGETRKPRLTPFEVCQRNEHWQRYGSMDECVSEVKERRKEKAAQRAQQQAESGQYLMNMVNPGAVAPRPSAPVNCLTRPGPYGSTTTQCQ